MAVSPKLPMLSLVPSAVVSAITPGDVGLSSLSAFPKPLKLDFAPSPARYRASAKAAKPQARKSVAAGGFRQRIDLSPRLELRLSVECEDGEEGQN